ncbi:MAG: LysR substrate-binding domain-containing protein [Gammaproteobacteria bacterium]|nr:LysR substrate-binding domain-containing protein [Gammaproteobacteria bacterium]
MSANLPTTKQLRYFSALAAENHFGRAADRCFVSQSAFSAAIKELETTLDTQLVDRTNRRVALTRAGTEFAVKAQDYLHSLEELVNDVSRKREPLTGNLRLGAIPTIAPFLLPKVLKRLRRKFKQLQLFLVEHQTAVLHQKLLDSDIDVALMALPMDLPGTESQTLFKDPFLLAYREGSRHVDPDNYSFGKLDSGSVMLMEDGHCLREHALDACRLRNSDKLNRFSASSLLSLIEMIEADLAISYLPELTAGSNLLKGTNIRLMKLSKNNYRDIGLVWRKGNSRAHEFRLLGDFIRNNR